MSVVHQQWRWLSDLHVKGENQVARPHAEGEDGTEEHASLCGNSFRPGCVVAETDLKDTEENQQEPKEHQKRHDPAAVPGPGCSSILQSE